MKGILECASELKNSGLRKIVDSRMKEFKDVGEGNASGIFKELCFCLLTANFNAEKSIAMQREIDEGFAFLNKNELEKRLSELGHRYPKARAKYIVEARKHRNLLKRTIESHEDEKVLREWLVENVKGLGYKEASHFLRNIGFENLAIIDFHIIDILTSYNVIERPKTLTKKKYLEIEKTLEKIAGKLGMNLAELDLYLWYAETGKVLK